MEEKSIFVTSENGGRMRIAETDLVSMYLWSKIVQMEQDPQNRIMGLILSDGRKVICQAGTMSREEMVKSQADGWQLYPFDNHGQIELLIWKPVDFF
jgi:hypothetical protein